MHTGIVAVVQKGEWSVFVTKIEISQNIIKYSEAKVGSTVLQRLPLPSPSFLPPLSPNPLPPTSIPHTLSLLPLYLLSPLPLTFLPPISIPSHLSPSHCSHFTLLSTLSLPSVFIPFIPLSHTHISLHTFIFTGMELDSDFLQTSDISLNLMVQSQCYQTTTCNHHLKKALQV